MNDNMHTNAQMFTKYYSDMFSEELEKANALYKLSCGHDFTVPMVLEIDQDKRCIHYEFLQGITSVRELYLAYVKGYCDDGNVLAAFNQIGRVLGVMHRDLRLIRRRVWQPNEAFNTLFQSQKESPQGFMHCDYGFANVFYIQENDQFKIVVIDPSPNAYLTYYPHAYGSIYVDLANFTACLDGLVPIRHYVTIKWHRVIDLKQAFIDGYQAVTGFTIDQEFLNACARVASQCYFNYKYTHKFVGQLALFTLYNPYKNRVMV